MALIFKVVNSQDVRDQALKKVIRLESSILYFYAPKTQSKRVSRAIEAYGGSH